MKVLLFGCEGQVGRACSDLYHIGKRQAYSADVHTLKSVMSELDWCDVELIAMSRASCDVTHADLVEQHIAGIRPDAIINATAYTHVDKAEANIPVAHDVNASAPAILAKLAAQYACRLIHYSTDYVFEGSKGEPYTEEDEPKPLNVYGRTKLAGEHNIINACDDYLILRCSWVFSPYKHNFLKSIVARALNNQSLRVVTDCFGAPTAAIDIAAITWLLILQHAKYTGVLHISSTPYTSWFGFARYLLEQLKDSCLINQYHLQATIMRDYERQAHVPQDSRLDSKKLTTLIKQAPPQWQLAAKSVIQHVVKESMVCNIPQ